MDRITAALDQAEDALQPSRIFGYSERCARDEAEGREPDNIGEIELLKLLIVRNVEKTGVWFNARFWHCYAVSVVK